MKFYITVEGVPKLKRSFLNLKLFSIISVPDILQEFGYTYSTIDEYGSFIVSKKINSLIKTHVKSKRIRGIIYSNPEMKEELLPCLFDTIEEIEGITYIVLLDEYNVPKLKKVYAYFDEIIFFPSIKKCRLIECNPIKQENTFKI